MRQPIGPKCPAPAHPDCSCTLECLPFFRDDLNVTTFAAHRVPACMATTFSPTCLHISRLSRSTWLPLLQELYSIVAVITISLCLGVQHCCMLTKPSSPIPQHNLYTCPIAAYSNTARRHLSNHSKGNWAAQRRWPRYRNTYKS